MTINLRPQRCHCSRRFDGEAEAHLIALACSELPLGCPQWTLRLLAELVMGLNYVDTVSYQTIRRTKKDELKLYLKQQRCILPEGNADFVWCMEDVLY